MSNLLFYVKTPAASWPTESTTFDPVNKGDRTTISDGNLVAVCGNGAPPNASAARSLGAIQENTKTIWEITLTAQPDAFCSMGFGTADHDLDGPAALGQDVYSIGCQNNVGGTILYDSGGVPGGHFGTGYVVGDIITWELERAGISTTFTCYVNGVSIGTRTLDMPSATGLMYAMVCQTVSLFASTFTANFSGPFQIEPTAGFSPIPA